jgi:hypothetical protein
MDRAALLIFDAVEVNPGKQVAVPFGLTHQTKLARFSEQQGRWLLDLRRISDPALAFISELT